MTYVRKEIIGDCTLYQADCADVMPTLRTVDAVVTDPPFGMDFQSNYRTIQHKKIANDTGEDFLKWAASIPFTYSSYIFCRWDNLASMPKPKSVINWVKNNWSMGDLKHEHARQTEIILFYQGASHHFPKGRPTDVVYADRTRNELHPTQKPVPLMQQIIGWCGGETVFDPFMGSGTTGVACAKLGRKFIGVEISQEYFDIACKRIEAAYAQPDMFIAPIEKKENVALPF